MRSIFLGGSTDSINPPNAVAGLVARIAGTLRRRQTIRELARLDDYLLTDIGLSRSDIGGAVDRVRG